jgi:hypothetical protein
LELRYFIAPQYRQKKRHEGSHLRLRSKPILTAKREKGKVGNTQVDTRGYNFTRHLSASAVPLLLFELPRLRPAIIAIHDDSNMPWQVTGGLRR